MVFPLLVISLEKAAARFVAPPLFMSYAHGRTAPHYILATQLPAGLRLRHRRRCQRAAECCPAPQRSRQRPCRNSSAFRRPANSAAQLFLDRWEFEARHGFLRAACSSIPLPWRLQVAFRHLHRRQHSRWRSSRLSRQETWRAARGFQQRRQLAPMSRHKRRMPISVFSAPVSSTLPSFMRAQRTAPATDHVNRTLGQCRGPIRWSHVDDFQRGNVNAEMVHLFQEAIMGSCTDRHGNLLAFQFARSPW